QSDLDHIAGLAAVSYETLTAEGIILSGRLTGKIGEVLETRNIAASALREHPEVLNEVQRACLDPALAALERNAASGVFMILDASLNFATSSRAGLFLRNMEPNALNRSTPSVYYLRGPITIAREHNINVLPQWLMEFPVVEGDFFHRALAGADGSLPPSRAYYWNGAEILTGDYDKALLVCVPLITPDGAVLGVCGFEVNAILFKMQNLPDTSVFRRAAAVFAPVLPDGSLDTSMAMFSSSHTLNMDGKLSARDYRNGLSVFESSGRRYVGLAAPVRLYSKNAVHAGQYAMALLVPEADLTAYVAQRNGGITVLFVFLFLCAMGMAAFLSHRYLTPVLRGLEQIKQRGAEGFKPTNLQEIDDLLDFLAEQDGVRENERRELEQKLTKLGVVAEREIILPGREAYEDFLRNLATLTKAEREVFDLYTQGHRAKDMPKLLSRSANTIKTHNKRIYDKLHISSREELLGFMQMMKENDEVTADE
ncbi:MAG: LuxR C-terminal-related transcriptional regulator, partial [Gracilibacteraceae bacterium]|nr:LuxR C-terminal-related transcriptional regulator [Gracilibacteraceae bacterium]